MWQRIAIKYFGNTSSSISTPYWIKYEVKDGSYCLTITDLIKVWRNDCDTESLVAHHLVRSIIITISTNNYLLTIWYLLEIQSTVGS